MEMGQRISESVWEAQGENNESTSPFVTKKRRKV